MPRRGWRWAAVVAGAVSLGGCVVAPTSVPTTGSTPRLPPLTNGSGLAWPDPGPAMDWQDEAPCPAGLAPTIRCYTGGDRNGAFFWIAMPANWNGVLVLHAHGGPEFAPPRAERTAEDLQRWKVMPNAGYAWAGSTYRQGGVAVVAAADDTENLRKIFVRTFGKPKTTLLHGQSWGAGVAAKAAERHPRSWDGVLLTSGVLGGAPASYDFRLDLRVVWQAVCGNHPMPDEPAYPLWQGLPVDSKLTRAELARRVADCTGVGRPAAERTGEQKQRLATVLGVVKIPERTLVSHLTWATWGFQDIAFRRLDGGDAFGNAGVRYTGSPDDAALNAAVRRYRADPTAIARLETDASPTGAIAVPVLTTHAIDDPTAFVELESSFRDRMAAAGHTGNLVQTFTDEHEHSYLADPEYLTLMEALLGWVRSGAKPTPQTVAERCQALTAGRDGGCRFVPGYRPAPLASRTPPRQP